MRLPYLVLFIYTYDIEALLFPEANGAWQERMSVQVHALHSGFYSAVPESLEESRREPMSSILRQDEQADDLDCLARRRILRKVNRRVERRRGRVRRRWRRRRTPIPVPNRRRLMRKPVVKRNIRDRCYYFPRTWAFSLSTAGAHNEHAAFVQHGGIV